MGYGVGLGSVSSGGGLVAANNLSDVADVPTARTNLGLGDALNYKTAIDCSANPNYPAGDAGDYHKISVAGKIGGASGQVVNIGDVVICNTDGTTAGTQAAKCAFWDFIPKADMADEITNTPAGNIAATTVQGALNELDTEKIAITSVPGDLSCQFIGVPAASAVGLRFVAVRAFTLLASGHKAKAAAAATAETDFILAVNGTTKATLRFAASGTTISIVGGVAATIAAGDVVTITAPASPDATLADIGFTLAATLL